MASAVSSIYGYVISAASAAYAPTNGTDVSAIASAYAEPKLDASASSSFYPSDNPSGFLTGVDLSNYATTAYVDSSISGKLDSSSQVVTSIGVAAGALSSINNYGLSAGTANSAGTALYDSAGRTLTSMVTKAEASSIANGYASGKLDTSAFSSVSGTFLTSVDLTPYQTTADMSGYLQTSESSNYYPTSNPSGFVTGVDLSDYATTAYVDSSVSSKLDSTAFDPNAFYPSGNPSGFLTGVDLSDYATKEYVDSSVSSKLDTTAFNSGDFYSTSNPSGFLTAVDLSPYQTTAGMTAYLGTAESANYYPTSNPSGFVTGIDLSDYATTAYVDSSVSGKLDSTAFNSGDFYPADNPSGFITGVNLSDYATTAYVDSSVSSKLDSSATSDFYSTSNPSGFLTAAYTPTFGYDGTAISSIDGSALAGGGGVDESTVSAIASAYAESAASSKLDSSATSDFYSTSNPSGFITAAYSPTFAYSGTAISSIDGSAVYDVSAQDGITALSAEIGDIKTILQSI